MISCSLGSVSIVVLLLFHSWSGLVYLVFPCCLVPVAGFDVVSCFIFIFSCAFYLLLLSCLIVVILFSCVLPALSVNFHEDFMWEFLNHLSFHLVVVTMSVNPLCVFLIVYSFKSHQTFWKCPRPLESSRLDVEIFYTPDQLLCSFTEL